MLINAGGVIHQTFVQSPMRSTHLDITANSSSVYNAATGKHPFNEESSLSAHSDPAAEYSHAAILLLLL
jgi:hypothetical protein